jgi:hypothetical protein
MLLQNINMHMRGKYFDENRGHIFKTIDSNLVARKTNKFMFPKLGEY